MKARSPRLTLLMLGATKQIWWRFT